MTEELANWIAQCRAESYAEGFDTFYEQFTRNMLKLGTAIKEVSKLTGLDLETVEQLNASLVQHFVTEAAR